MNIRKQGCWCGELTFVSWLSDGNWWSRCQEKVDCGGNTLQTSHSLSQGSLKAYAWVVAIWKRRPWITELVFVFKMVQGSVWSVLSVHFKMLNIPRTIFSFDFGPLQSSFWTPPSLWTEGAAGVSTFISHITSVSAHWPFPFGSSLTLAYKKRSWGTWEDWRGFPDEKHYIYC